MDNYCPRIHHGLTLSNISDTGVTYSACCWAKKTVSSEHVDFDNPQFLNLRSENKNNNLPSDYCSTCLNQEAAGQQSMRQGYLATHSTPTVDPSLQYLDINIDYTCNLACVTCGPELSTKWRNELGIKQLVVRPHIDNFIKTRLDTLDLAQLKEIRLWGGEPLLTNTHKHILEHVVKSGNASNIKLMYNTNGTQRIDEATKKLIEQFKFARISFSVDGIGPEFEYLRYPAKWTDVEQNLFWWKNNLPHNSMLSITLTASILNVLHLDNVFNWHREYFNKSCYGDDIEIYVHQAFGPFALEAMPADMVEHLKSIENYSVPWIQQSDIIGSRPEMLSKLLDLLTQIDRRRNLYLSDVLPDVAKFINYRK